MDQTIEQIYAAALEEIASADSADAIRSLNTRYLGRKGVLTQFLRNIAQLPAAERPGAGSRANKVKQQIDTACQQALARLTAASQGQARRIDVSLPGFESHPVYGHLVSGVAEQDATDESGTDPSDVQVTDNNDGKDGGP